MDAELKTRATERLRLRTESLKEMPPGVDLLGKLYEWRKARCGSDFWRHLAGGIRERGHNDLNNWVISLGIGRADAP